MKVPAIAPIVLLSVAAATGWIMAGMYASLLDQSEKARNDAIANTTEAIQSMKDCYTMFICCDSNLNVLMDAVTNYIHREHR